MSSLEVKRKRKDSSNTSDEMGNLPDNVTQRILEYLPLQEAAKTSILSSHWRYKWASTSQLILDETFFRSILQKRLETYDNLSSAYSNIINSILFSHVGSVCKFVLYLPREFFNEMDKMNQWMQYVRANGVKELTLSGHCRLPECLFSCVALTHLTLLTDCQYYLSIPPTFRGFPFLVSLKLSSHDLVIGKTELKSLISKCPLLEILCIETFHLPDLTIRAPKLQDFCLKGIIPGLSLERAKAIERLDLNIFCQYLQKSKNMDAFFSCLPKVEKFILRSLFWRHIWYREFISPKKFAQDFEQLRILQLVDVPLNCSHSMYFLLSLVKSAPNLEQLYVKAEKENEVCDEVQIDGSCNLKHLRKVQLVNISGLKNESLLIKFILANSPELREMSIELNKNLIGVEEKYKFAKELMRYRRASPDAEISFEEKEVRV